MKNVFFIGLFLSLFLNFQTFASGNMEQDDQNKNLKSKKESAEMHEDHGKEGHHDDDDDEKEHHDDHEGKGGHDDHDDHDEKDDHDDHEGKGDHDDHDEKGGHDEHEEGGKAIGKGKAITEVSDTKGFKLSKEAFITLKLKLKPVKGNELEVSKKTLVLSNDLKGVYRLRDGYFKFLIAKILKHTKNGYQVKVKGLRHGDQIVVEGTGLLKIADIFSSDKADYGHSH